MNHTSEGSNMRNSVQRKAKRSFIRPKASNILGLDKDGPISMQNTISTKGDRVELLVAGKEVGNLISSIDNSSAEIVEDRPMESKLGRNSDVIKIAEN